MIPFLGLPGVPAVQMMYWTVAMQLDKAAQLISGTAFGAAMEQMRDSFLTILRAYGWPV